VLWRAIDVITVREPNANEFGLLPGLAYSDGGICLTVPGFDRVVFQNSNREEAVLGEKFGVSGNAKVLLMDFEAKRLLGFRKGAIDRIDEDHIRLAGLHPGLDQQVPEIAGFDRLDAFASLGRLQRE
jgi:hypothetical protein